MKIYIVGSVALAMLAFASAAQATPIFAQTPVTNSSEASDRQFNTVGNQTADDFTLGTPATARSITWRGIYFENNTPAFPASFDLTIYGDQGGLPNMANVVTTIHVQFSSAANITDTGLLTSGATLYEFRANLNPTALAAGKKYWFSPLADTGPNTGNQWYWARSRDNDAAADRTNIATGTFASTTAGPFYFILNDTAVPEPAGLAVMSIATVGFSLMRRRRPSPDFKS